MPAQNSRHWNMERRRNGSIPADYKPNADIPPVNAPLPDDVPADAAPHTAETNRNSPADILRSLSGSLDADRLLIAAMLILLSKEGADTALILALAYILL